MVTSPPLWKSAALIAAIASLSLSASGQTAPAAPAPVTPNSFADVTAQLDPGGEFYLYVSTAQWLARLSDAVDTVQNVVLSSHPQSITQIARAAEMSALAKDVIRKSGLQDISGLGASSFNYAPGLYRNKIFLHHYPAQSTGLIWSLYGKSTHPLTALDMLPADTSAASYGDFDLAQLINFVRTEAVQSGIPEYKQAVDQAETQFFGVSGLKLDDVLASLNGSLGAVITLDASNIISIPINQQVQMIPAPRLAFLIAVKNDLIFNQVNKMIAGNPGVIKTEEPGLRMRTMPVPFVMPTVNLRPSIASWNGFLIIATDDTIIRKIIAAQKEGHGFKDMPEYARLSAGLPQQGNSFAIMTQLAVDTMKKFQDSVIANAQGPAPTQAAKAQQMVNEYQQILRQYQHTGPAISIGGVLPNGLLSVSQGTQGSGQLLAPILTVPASIMSGVIIPMMDRVQPATSSVPGAMNPYPSPTPGTSP
jgi:hypothetical protein